MAGAVTGALAFYITLQFYMMLTPVVLLYVVAVCSAGYLMSGLFTGPVRPVTGRDYLEVGVVWAAFWVVYTIIWMHTGLLLALLGMTRFQG